MKHGNNRENALLQAVREIGLEHEVAEGEAAIYGPKLDFMVTDAIGREWQLGTVQVDYLAERFDLEYIAEDGKAHRPVIIHRAFGSLQSICGVLIEHFAGAFPFGTGSGQNYPDSGSAFRICAKRRRRIARRRFSHRKRFGQR